MAGDEHPSDETSRRDEQIIAIAQSQRIQSARPLIPGIDDSDAPVAQITGGEVAASAQPPVSQEENPFTFKDRQTTPGKQELLFARKREILVPTAYSSPAASPVPLPISYRTEIVTNTIKIPYASAENSAKKEHDELKEYLWNRHQYRIQGGALATTVLLATFVIAASVHALNIPVGVQDLLCVCTVVTSIATGRKYLSNAYRLNVHERYNQNDINQTKATLNVWLQNPEEHREGIRSFANDVKKRYKDKSWLFPHAFQSSFSHNASEALEQVKDLETDAQALRAQVRLFQVCLGSPERQGTAFFNAIVQAHKHRENSTTPANQVPLASAYSPR